MLTGKMRYRVQKFTYKLVLQVEEEITIDRGYPHYPHCSDIVKQKIWRDAKLEDLGLLEVNAITRR